jgi:hypothetical protein
MFKLEQLALAMITVEGWYWTGQKSYAQGSRSFRNHNPGNLRSSPFQVGNDGGFAVFRTDLEGWQAMIWDLQNKALGKTITGLNGNSTLKDLIWKWAPPSDNNNSQAYLNAVCRMTGFLPTMKLKELLE